MKDSIERVVKDLGAIRIENMVGSKSPTNMIGLYPEDYETDASHFSCSEEHPIIQRSGGKRYAKKN